MAPVDGSADFVSTHNRRPRFPRWLVASIIGIPAMLAFLWMMVRFRIRPLETQLPAVAHAELLPDGKATVRYRGATFVTTVATFNDELFAYLMYQHFRVSREFSGNQLLLRYNTQASQGKYEVILPLGSDLIAGINCAANLATDHYIEQFSWRLITNRTLSGYQDQTRLFVSAYTLPVRKKMEELSKAEARNLVRRFIRFKSTTDPRLRKRMEPAPDVLTPAGAQRLAGDIIAVAEFYDLPLDFLLGIGAMENNYMNVRGDLKHSVWKRRPAKDDIVLERRKGRVRVLNDSAGLWQLTRETLRFVHRLYLRDTRDYTKLPEHLRPPERLDIDNVSPDVLTTYAGLLLRQLLDHFHGDVGRAIGAYNGGPGNPNRRYEEGVRGVALQARSILEHAAALNGRTVIQMSWLRSR